MKKYVLLLGIAAASSLSAVGRDVVFVKFDELQQRSKFGIAFERELKLLQKEFQDHMLPLQNKLVEIQKETAELYKEGSDRLLFDKKAAELESLSRRFEFEKGDKEKVLANKARAKQFEAQRKIQEAVVDCAKEKGYEAVLDSGSCLFLKDGADNTEEFLAFVNKAYDKGLAKASISVKDSKSDLSTKSS